MKAYKIVDQELDLGRVELHALDFSGQLFGECFVFLLLGRRERLAAAEYFDALDLELLEFAEQVLDPRKAFDGIGLERRFHLGEGHGVVLVLVVVRLGRTFLAVFAVLVVVRIFVVIVADRGTGGFFGDFAVVVIVFRIVRHLVGRRFLGQHGVEIEDLAQLHFLVVEGFGPLNDGVEGDRALAKAHDHHVAAGLDALGNCDFAFAA